MVTHLAKTQRHLVTQDNILNSHVVLQLQLKKFLIYHMLCVSDFG